MQQTSRVQPNENTLTDISIEPRPSLALYVLGSIISWPLYAVLIALLYRSLGFRYLSAASLSWVLSYLVVYAVQTRGTFSLERKVLLEMLLYVVFVIALSGIINFGLLHVLQVYTLTSRLLATASAALLAAAAGFMMSRIVLGTRTSDVATRR